jgi:flagellar biogenesis protein FliO
MNVRADRVDHRRRAKTGLPIGVDMSVVTILVIIVLILLAIYLFRRIA